MRIIGIDPGYDRLGIAIVDKPTRDHSQINNKNKEELVFSECFETSSQDSMHKRLFEIGSRVKDVLEEFEPDEMAIETLFITKNQKTAMRVAEARGIIIFEAIKRGVAVSEYSPMQIKTAITGDGTSDKSRIMKMVGLLVNMGPKNGIPPESRKKINTKSNKILDDEYDAIAVALTHSAIARPIQDKSVYFIHNEK